MALTRAQMDAKLDEHFGFEAADNVEGVLATLTPDVVHDIVGWPAGPARSRDDIRFFYESLFADLADGKVSSTRRLYGENFMVDDAVWRGTATRLNDIHLQLYCDDPKSAEIALINQRLDYDVGSVPGPRGQSVDCLSLTVACPGLGGEAIGLHLTILDLDDLRGALKPDARGRTERGDLDALKKMMEDADHDDPHPPR